MQVEVGFIAFHKFKPYFVHKLKNFNSCYCWYHHEMLDRFNNMRASTMYHGSQDGKFCTCGCKAICANPGHKTIVNTIISCQTIKRTYRSTLICGRICCVQKKWAKNGLGWIMLKVYIHNVASCNCLFVIESLILPSSH